MSEARILVISLSEIHRDARVLRQLSVVREFGHVTTVGFGPSPSGADVHLQVPEGLATLPQTPVGVAKLSLRRLRSAELSAPAVQWALEALEDQRFDAVVANEARVLALADRLADGAPIWADMHEWAPEERTHVLSWRLLVAPLMDHLCRQYLPRATAITTVGDRIAELYRTRYEVDTLTMRNTTPHQDLTPSDTPEDGMIRAVHSGGAVPGRNIELMIDTFRGLSQDFTLDLYLVPAADGGTYLRSLRKRAQGCPTIRFNEAVSPGDLPKTLNAFDLGVYWLRPVNKNGELALPNKFFDFVQARLALAVGPSIEMASLVKNYGMGTVSEGFEQEDAARSLRAITRVQIAEWKQNSHRASAQLSFERDAEVAREVMRTLLGAV